MTLLWRGLRIAPALVAAGLLVGCATAENATDSALKTEDLRRSQLASNTVVPTVAISDVNQHVAASQQLAQADESIDDELEDDDDFFPSAIDDGQSEIYDPLETLNRFMFAINETLDIFILQPVAATYHFLLPQVVQDSVRNATRNLNAPVIFANELFQGKTDRASSTVARFAINSTAGLLGVFDVAEDWGYPYYNEDFGQTLGVYNMSPGAYLVLPIIGPSSTRDGFGRLVDAVLDPWNYVMWASGVEREDRFVVNASRFALAGVDLRARNLDTLEEIRRDSVDYYARIRSLYIQSRASKVRSAQPPGNPPSQ